MTDPSSVPFGDNDEAIVPFSPPRTNDRKTELRRPGKLTIPISPRRLPPKENENEKNEQIIPVTPPLKEMKKEEKKRDGDVNIDVGTESTKKNPPKTKTRPFSSPRKGKGAQHLRTRIIPASPTKSSPRSPAESETNSRMSSRRSSAAGSSGRRDAMEEDGVSARDSGSEDRSEPATPQPRKKGSEKKKSKTSSHSSRRAYQKITDSPRSANESDKPEEKIYSKNKTFTFPEHKDVTPRKSLRYDPDESGLEWDGSYLGEFPTSAIIAKFEHVQSKVKYIEVELHEKTIRAIIRPTKNALPCIFDELKILFGVPKLGTHLVKFGSKLYLLQRCNFIGGHPTVEQTLQIFVNAEAKVLNKPEFREIVQKTFAFRSILGLPISNEGSIVVRYEKGKFVPYSFREPKTGILDSVELTQKVVKTWFPDQEGVRSLPEVVQMIVRESYEERSEEDRAYEKKYGAHNDAEISANRKRNLRKKREEEKKKAKGKGKGKKSDAEEEEEENEDEEEKEEEDDEERTDDEAEERRLDEMHRQLDWIGRKLAQIAANIEPMFDGYISSVKHRLQFFLEQEV